VGNLKRTTRQALAAAGAIALPVHAVLMPTDGPVQTVREAVDRTGPEKEMESVLVMADLIDRELDSVREHLTDRGAHRACLGTKLLRQDDAADLDQMVRSGPEVASGAVAATLSAQCVATGHRTTGRHVMAGPIVDDNSLVVKAASEIVRRAADGLEWPPGSAVRVAMVAVAAKVTWISAILVGQWASMVGEVPGPADALEEECATALDHAGLPEVPDRAASDRGDSVAGRVRVVSLACGRASVLVVVAGPGGAEALVLIAALPVLDRAVSVARRGWVRVEALVAPAALLVVRASMTGDVMAGDSDLDRDSLVSKGRAALAMARIATADAAVRRAVSAATVVRGPTAREDSVAVDLMVRLPDQGVAWVADQGAMAAVVRVADSPAPAASASTVAMMMARRSTKTSTAGRS
jgi:hypothetical protein